MNNGWEKLKPHDPIVKMRRSEMEMIESGIAKDKIEIANLRKAVRLKRAEGKLEAAQSKLILIADVCPEILLPHHEDRMDRVEKAINRCHERAEEIYRQSTT